MFVKLREITVCQIHQTSIQQPHHILQLSKWFGWTWKKGPTKVQVRRVMTLSILVHLLNVGLIQLIGNKASEVDHTGHSFNVPWSRPLNSNPLRGTKVLCQAPLSLPSLSHLTGQCCPLTLLPAMLMINTCLSSEITPQFLRVHYKRFRTSLSPLDV